MLLLLQQLLLPQFLVFDIGIYVGIDCVRFGLCNRRFVGIEPLAH
jgi:hypothetical protein